MIKLFPYILLVITLTTCATQKKTVIIPDPTKPPCIVYKTRSNYDSLVHIRLTEDKKHVAFYPAPVDVLYNGVLAYPTKLAKGYLLDNRGININSAFINITLAEYSRLAQAPTEREFLERIVDADPITEIFYCGNKSYDIDFITNLNTIINNNRMDEWEKIK